MIIERIVLEYHTDKLKRRIVEFLKNNYKYEVVLDRENMLYLINRRVKF